MNELKVVKDILVYKDDRYYSTFPNIVKLKNDDLMVSFRQAPNRIKQYGDMTHGDPASVGVFVKSTDNGETWDENTSTIYDDFFYGVQDPCINYLKDGTILSTFFMWKYGEFADKPDSPRRLHAGYNKYYMDLVDAFTSRSYDQGKTWDKPMVIDYFAKQCRSSVRGNIAELDEGSIVIALPSFMDKQTDRCINVLKSNDQGKTWELLSVIESSNKMFHGEPNLYLTKKGKLVILMRTHIVDGDRNVYEDGNNDMSPMHYAESFDFGRTWSKPEATNFCTPCCFEAIELKSGNVLMTFGQRYNEYGIYAVSLDSEMNNLKTAKAILIKACPNTKDPHDLGYSRSVLLPNGNALIVYYMHGEDGIRYINGTVVEEI